MGVLKVFDIYNEWFISLFNDWISTGTEPTLMCKNKPDVYMFLWLYSVCKQKYFSKPDEFNVIKE